MKKVAMLLSLLLLLATMAACGEAPASSGANTSSKTEASSSAAESSAAGSEETPASTAGGDVLIMATNAFFEPYEYYEGDNIVGIDAEIGAAIAKELGMEFQISDIEFDSIIPAIQSGKASMGMAGMTVTPDREKNVNFTKSYATGIQVVIVKEDSPIASIDDLEGKKIGVQQGTTGDLYCSDDYGEDAVTRYSKGTDAVMALLSGKVDCVVIDNEPAKSFVSQNEGLKILDTEYALEDYAIAIAKENTELLDKVNAALDKLITDGTVQDIVDKYIKAE